MIERKTNLGKVLEGKFISQVLEEEGQDINSEIGSNMSGFSNQTNRGRSFMVKDKTLVYTFPMTNRFIDMKTRQTLRGKINKKNYSVHNKILFWLCQQHYRKAFLWIHSRNQRGDVEASQS